MGATGGARRLTRYRTGLAEVCSRVHDRGARYVLFGAMAMQLWGTTRATRDIDILIDATVDNARRVLAALSEAGLGLAAEWLAEEVVSKPVTASIEHLIASKRTGRLQDAADIEVLEEIVRLRSLRGR